MTIFDVYKKLHALAKYDSIIYLGRTFELFIIISYTLHFLRTIRMKTVFI